MAKEITLPEYDNQNGILTVIEKIFATDIKRVFFIYGIGSTRRGGHSHKYSQNALICLNGKCKILVKSKKQKAVYILDHPSKCLLLAPDDYREMYNFSENAILLVVSDSYYDQKDYILK